MQLLPYSEAPCLCASNFGVAAGPSGQTVHRLETSSNGLHGLEEKVFWSILLVLLPSAKTNI
jgi:hypothetical protein